VGDQGIQYFIHPLEFTDVNNTDASLSIDITCRNNNAVNDSAIINLSLRNKSDVRPVDSISIKTDSISVTMTKLNQLFAEREDERVHARFTSNVPSKNIRRLFLSVKWDIMVYANKQVMHFSAAGSVQKKIAAIQYSVFSLF
jgi:hypothetical protein